MAEETAGKQRQRGPGRPFTPGQSGNPAGRPLGARNAALVALDAIGTTGAAAVLRKVVTKARGGDMRAAEVLLSRCWPARKGRPIALTIPPLDQPGGLAAAVATVISAVADGTITPDEGQTLTAMLDLHRRAIEVADLERRIAALEKRRGVA